MTVCMCITVYWLVASLDVVIIQMGELPIKWGSCIRLRLEFNLHFYLLAAALRQTPASSLFPPPAWQMTI